MMQKNDCFQLGQIVKAHGFKGELISQWDVDSPSAYKNIKEIYVEINGKLVRFDIDKIKLLEKNNSLIKIKGIDDEEMASALLNSNLYLPLTYLPELSDTQFYYHEIINYHVIDTEKGNIGKILRVLDMPQQAILEIQHESGKEILIPVTDEIIKKVNRTEKQLFINAPEGLIDIYLS
jgi:16S rRNA processing protein RimM